MSRRLSPVLLALLALVLVGGGIVTAVLAGGSGPEDPPAAQPDTNAPVAPSTPSAGSGPDPSAEPSTEPSVAPTAEPSTAPDVTGGAPAPAAGDPVAFVRDYYALLPGNTDAAWPLLSPTAQRQSGGRGGFDRFYARMESVTLENVRAVDANTVEATVVFDERNGPTSRDPYRFVLSTGDDGRPIMQSFSQL